MFRLMSAFLALQCALIMGCSQSGNSNIMDGADQAAIDAYDAQVKANEEAMGGYKEIK